MSYKRWVLVAVFLFGIGLVSGLAAPAELIVEDIAGLEELADFLAPLPRSAVFVVILIKNVSALLIGFALSPVFCLVPILALTVNGWLLGVISVAVAQEESVAFVLTGLLPHGIFEIPALILGAAAALSFGSMVVVALFKKERRSLLLPSLKQNLGYLMIACALLVPAAIIEAYITPLLVS